MISVGIIGGGASGIMAAIKAADGRASVTILERKDKIGKKILVTGNGRCNFTNKNMFSSCYYTDDETFVSTTLSKFSETDLIRFFTEAGVLCKEKNGYYYPASEQASTILDALKYELKERNVNVITDCDVIKIEKKNDKFMVYDSHDKTYKFDRLIISTGGKSSLPKNEKANGYSLLRSFGVESSKTYPALTSLVCKGFNFKGVSGVRSECEISLVVNGNTIMHDGGEVLFNDQGISGIVTFQISHAALENCDNGNNVKVFLDLLPGISEEDLRQFINTKAMLHPDLSIEEFFTGIHNKKMCYEIIRMNSIDPFMPINKISNNKLCDVIGKLKKLEFIVCSDANYEKSQVTGGGISLDKIKDSFELKDIPGLYVTGELLNVDGICGGYNLQWAFSSGYIAGSNIVQDGV